MPHTAEGRFTGSFTSKAYFEPGVCGETWQTDREGINKQSINTQAAELRLDPCGLLWQQGRPSPQLIGVLVYVWKERVEPRYWRD